MHAPPSISIPFPPFGGKEVPATKACCHARPVPGGFYNKAGRLFKAHPYVVGGGAALAMTVGLGIVRYAISRKVRRVGTRGVVQNGMLKEAIGESTDGGTELTPSPPLSIAHPVDALAAGRLPAQSWLHCADRGPPRGGCRAA